MSNEQEQCLECLEQARLLGMGAERELKLMAERDNLLALIRCVMSIPTMTDEQLAELKKNAEQAIRSGK
jgi:hypothetical protein